MLLLGAYTWVFLAKISKKLEGVHVGFLPSSREGTWRSVAAASLFKEAGTQTLGTYIDKRQATVVVQVSLRPILEVCDSNI